MKSQIIILFLSVFGFCNLSNAQNRDVNVLMSEVRERFNQVKDYEASARIKIDVIIALIIDDFPAPVAPATNRCGILAKLAHT